MNESNEVFLGQKKSIARFNLDTQKSIWSKNLESTPLIISTCGENILVQSINSWGTKYSHQLLNAQTGKEVWMTNEIKTMIVPQYHKGNIFFISSKGLVSKLCGSSGELLFETQYKKWYQPKCALTVAKNKIYLLSKKRSFLVDSNSGQCSELSELANFTKNTLTAVYGNGIDQMALFSVLAYAGAAGTGDAGVVNAGAGGDSGGGGE